MSEKPTTVRVEIPGLRIIGCWFLLKAMIVVIVVGFFLFAMLFEIHDGSVAVRKHNLWDTDSPMQKVMEDPNPGIQPPVQQDIPPGQPAPLPRRDS